MATRDNIDHAQAVSDWLARGVRDHPSEKKIDRFCLGFNAVWLRAKRTLGDVTLLAIGERALHLGVERYPLLAGLNLGSGGIDITQLRPKALETSPEELEGAMAYVLTEILSVLGRLTGEILSLALHTELAAAATTDDPANLLESHEDGGNGEAS